MLNIFKKKTEEVKEIPRVKNQPERDVRELLRENLNLLQVDMFYKDDPIVTLSKEDRLIYLKYFSDLLIDKRLMDRIKFHINNQARKSLENSKNGIQDMAGALCINGLAFVMDDITKLNKLYVKEKSPPPKSPLDKFAIMPQDT